MRRALIIFRNLLLVCAGLMVCVAAFAVWCSQTKSGRAFSARRIERVVTKGIPGRLQIGRLTSWNGGQIDAEDVRFFHPDGRCLLYVREAHIDYDFAEAWHGRIAWHGVTVNGGYIVLSLDPDGRLSFEATVNAPKKPGEHSDPNGGLHYAMRAMHVQNFRVLLKLGDPIDYRIEHVSGYVGVRRIDTPGVQVNFERIEGDVEPKVAGERVRIEQLDGWVHGAAPKVAEFKAQLAISSGHMDTRLEYFNRDKDKLKIHIEHKSGIEGLAVTWLLHAVAGFSSAISVEG
jgi:hypothetical protein